MSDPLDLDVVALASALRRRRLSALDVTDAYLARIEATEPKVNAYINVFGDTARRRARALDRRRSAGPLHGVPLAMKDLIDERGRVTTAGSRLRTAVAASDAPVALRLRRAGAVFLGRLNLHEFAGGATGANPHYGPACNPHDVAFITGGSSSGSAAAVAARSAAATIGTDTGGSIRIPAALCGVVGLKPTYDLVPRRGVEPLAWSLDHIGPLTRTVRDAALLLDVMAGRHPSVLAAGARGLRVGIPDDYFFEGIDPSVRRGCAAARSALRDAGAREVRVHIPHIAIADSVRFLIARAEISAWHGEDLARHASLMGEDIRALVRMGLRVSAVDYLQAQRVRTLLLEEMNAVFKTCDVLLVPTTAAAAIRIGRTGRRVAGRWQPVRRLLVRFTSPFNLTGHPALALPAGTDARGLPVSAQLVGRHFDERTVLRAAAAAEASLGPWRPAKV